MSITGSLKKESKRSMKKRLDVSWNFILAWTKSPRQRFTTDRRGWEKGKPRRHPIDLRARIVRIRKQLVRDPRVYYRGALAVQQQYQDLYPKDPLPAIDTINGILHDVKLSHIRRNGAAEPSPSAIRSGASIGRESESQTSISWTIHSSQGAVCRSISCPSPTANREDCALLSA